MTIQHRPAITSPPYNQGLERLCISSTTVQPQPPRYNGTSTISTVTTATTTTRTVSRTPRQPRPQQRHTTTSTTTNTTTRTTSTTTTTCAATSNSATSHAPSSPPGRIRRDTSAHCTGLWVPLVGGVFADLSPPLGLLPKGYYRRYRLRETGVETTGLFFSRLHSMGALISMLGGDVQPPRWVTRNWETESAKRRG